jgi:methyl-accepting chemotaxis protein
MGAAARRLDDKVSSVAETNGRLAEAIPVFFDEGAFSRQNAEAPRSAKLGPAVEACFSGKHPADAVAQALAGGIAPEMLLDALDFTFEETLPTLSTLGWQGARARERVAALARRYVGAIAEVHRTLAERRAAEKQARVLANAGTDKLDALAEAVTRVNDVAVEIVWLSRNADDAADGAEQIASATTEMVTSIEEISRAAQATRQGTETARVAADEVTTTVGSVTTTMQAISEAISAADGEVGNLTATFDQIATVLGVIDTIARQTNLLALNATIEAARAEENGKGFAIVAQEVKTLSQQTAEATRTIGEDVERMRAVIGRIGSVMSRSLAAVDDGNEVVHSAAGAVSRISATTARMAELVDSISGAVEEQATASGVIAGDAERASAIAKRNRDLLASMSDKLQAGSKRFAELANQWFDATSPRSLCVMAMIDHVNFRKRAVDAVAGLAEWASAEVPDHHRCRLGKWYDAIGDETILKAPAFGRLAEPHAAVHAAARRALAAAEAGNQDEAIAALDAVYDASCAVLDGLHELSAEIAAHEPSCELDAADRHPVARLFDGMRERNTTVVELSGDEAVLTGLRKADIGRHVVLSHASGCFCGCVVSLDGEAGRVKFDTRRA